MLCRKSRANSRPVRVAMIWNALDLADSSAVNVGDALPPIKPNLSGDSLLRQPFDDEQTRFG
jgi:hypothetical protein